MKLKKLWKNPLVKFSILFLGEGGTGGAFPGCVAHVILTYVEEKETGKTPNIAEYITVGIPAAAVDGVGAFLSLTVIFSPLSYAITIPFLGLLLFWRLTKGMKPVKKKLKTKKS